MAKKATASKSTSKATKATKSTKATEKATPEKAKAKGPVERDTFGASLNSQVARINAALSNTPQTAKDIASKANANLSACQSHLRTLLGKELIIRTDEGYSLKVEKKARARKRTSK